jgi:putative phosphoserine phosphatase/1-acylglycerol-3-phosphate O-acyltransferase
VNTQRTAAFFDLDKTLIREDSQTMELRQILTTEKPSLPYYFKLLETVITYPLARMNLASQEFHNLCYLKTYRGQRRDVLELRGKSLFQRTLRHMFHEKALELMAEHRKNGRWIILVSATPAHLLSPVIDHIRPDGSACTLLEFDASGRCTGKPRDALCIGEKKAEHVRRIAAAMSLDLSSSFAYSDHHADIPFLESVGCPSVVNPTTRLLKIARKRDWPVYRF